MCEMRDADGPSLECRSGAKTASTPTWVLAPLLGNDHSDHQLPLSTIIGHVLVRGPVDMPRQQLELAPGELVALPGGANQKMTFSRRRRRRPAGQLADGGGWVAGRGWMPRRGGVVGPTRGVDPSMQRTSPPSCGVRGHRPTFAARRTVGVRKSCDLQSGVSRNFLRFKCVSYCSQSIKKVSCACSERLG